MLYTNVVFEQDIDLHMGHMSKLWSGDLTSCQSNSDLRTSNMLYANQIALNIQNITETKWSVVNLSLQDVLLRQRSGHY